MMFRDLMQRKFVYMQVMILMVKLIVNCRNVQKIEFKKIGKLMKKIYEKIGFNFDLLI